MAKGKQAKGIEPGLETSIEKARRIRADMSYEGTGRPTLMTPEVVKKLEEVFAIGGTDKEACFYADISHQTLYNYQEKHPEFVERKEALKNRPILKARQTVVKNLDNPEMAFKFLERKVKDEFAPRNEQTGAGGKDLIPEGIPKDKQEELLALLKPND